MGVRITDDRTVALYDSTTGEAFGPLFDGRQQAEDFIDWLNEGYASKRTFSYGRDTLYFMDDARLYGDGELQHLYQLFLESESET